MATIQEHLEAARISDARSRGATPGDIQLAQLTGIDPCDVLTLGRFTCSESLLIVIRCPSAAAMGWHGIFPAKTAATAAKTGESGTVVRPRTFIVKPDGETHIRRATVMVSDYDLMSVWRSRASDFEKIYVSAIKPGAKKGAWPEEARALIKRLNGQLITKIQHGAQDDWHSKGNPDVKDEHRFVAFCLGKATFLPSHRECALYYGERGLFWPYDAAGHYVGPVVDANVAGSQAGSKPASE